MYLKLKIIHVILKERTLEGDTMIPDPVYDKPKTGFLTRFQGMKRGVLWEPEPPEKYGIEKGQFVLPLWAFEGFFYYFAIYPFNSRFFALYKEGDWFDGRENGHGIAASGMAELINEIEAPDPNHAVMLWKLEDGTGWQTYIADKERIEAWMELHTPMVKHDTSDKMTSIIKPENLKIDEEAADRSMRGIVAQRNRLRIWLENKALSSSLKRRG